MTCKVNIGKIALLLCNFIFLLSGFCLILLGCVLLNDAPRILLSQLALEPGTLPQPFLYYVALGFVTAGMIVSSVALLGCWTSLGPDSNCLMAIYMFLIVLLLLVEISVGVVGSLCPQVIGGGMDRDQMVASLMNNYGVPGRDQYTAAVDLAQTIFECCGMQSGSDYDGSRWWKREQDSKHELRVPRSCCFLENTSHDNAFLDPIPLNITLCQAKNNARYQLGRHVKGCIDQLNTWFKDHVTIFLIIGSALVVVQLCVLLCAIIVCLRKRKPSGSSRSSASVTSSEPSTSHAAKTRLPDSDRKNVKLHENGFPVEAAGTTSSLPAPVKRCNYSFRNLNYTDTESVDAGKGTDFALRQQDTQFPSFDENRNRSAGTCHVAGKFHTILDPHHRTNALTHPHVYYACKGDAFENDLMQYDAMSHYFRKGGDLTVANNGRNVAELGT